MATIAQSTANVDDEENQHLMDCLDLLVAAGYFRARIKGLAAFDKIVGGMVWCLYHCNRPIDADLLFEENLDIGQKIALTEKIVKVLCALQCPHSIEPHQIQGLDLVNIYPVIQWLVRMAMDSKASRAEQLKSYIDYQYNKSCKKAAPTTTFLRSYSSLHESIVPQRKFKRGKNLRVSSLLEDAYCTLAEYSGRTVAAAKLEGAFEGASTSVFQPDQLEELSEKQRFKVSTKTAKRIFEAIDENVQAAASSTLAGKDSEASLDAQIEEAERYLEELEKKLEFAKQELAKSNAEHDAMLEQKKQEEELYKRFTPAEIEEARKLLEEYENVKKREQDFKEAAEAELNSLRKQIELYETAPEQITELQLKKVKEELAAERLRLAEVNQEIAALSYELDSVPSETEMAQYHQRIIELYNQLESRHRQAKQYVTMHNTLLDLRNYIKKDIELLSKIEEVLPQARKESYRDSFIEHLTTINRSVEAFHKKVTDRTAVLMEEKKRLTAKYNQLKSDRRQYYQLLDVMKTECERNKQLRKLLAEKEKEHAKKSELQS